MSRRRDYLSFFGRRGRRKDLVFVREPGARRRWLIPALLLAAAGGFAWWWFARPGPAEQPDTTPVGVSSVPTVLHPETSTTTSAAVETVSCPAADQTVHWLTFQATSERTGCIDAPTITDPVVLWKAKVGVQGWLNNPVVVEDTVYVGSAGDTQFETDTADGVYAIDLTTGTRVWFFAASLDVNGVAVSDGVVVATGDEGLVWGIDAAEGLGLWTANLEAAVFTNPLIVEDMVVVGDGSGAITAFDLESGERRWQVTVQGAVRGGAASDGESIYVVSEGRDVIALDLQGNDLWRQTISGPSGESEQWRVFAAPTIAGRLLVVSLIRGEDVHADPALMALDRATGDVAWRAQDAAGIKSEWANVRSSPAVVGDLLVYGETYSDRLVAVGIEDGLTRWSVKVGPYCFQHWPSPAVVSGQVILPRYDGGLYAVALDTKTIAWSIYLGQQALNGEFPADFGEDFCRHQPRSGASVIASPAVADNGVVLVGTLEGYLMAVGDASW
jgi:outer membrane protein assembly factor BamB